ncbi:MAG: hypothetical protein P0Y49_13125 [Candidatus Pedobacter colombiensis]|uniref:Lipoprotein n=1 Tax=Candidatus Pedobacter colombiensis TaxID=3121371 RepID=A0AAJ5W467_9SPHI|nr:hypothetical protein [Pedobacter sp.]WEK17739.1 MAG: hypothetical protein P0Y49_13125 [Pedobacter sp.]
MNNSIRPFIDRLIAKGFKPFAMSLLIVLCLISSCSIRKGIQAIFTGNAIEHINGKPGKSVIQHKSVEYVAAECSTAGQNLDLQQSLTKQDSSKKAMMPLLFLLLPGFLLSLRTIKDKPGLPVPYSRLQWSCLPLFLQNRLLLI